VLSKHKPDTKTQFIDASGLFKKETNNNAVTDEHMERVMEVFDSKEDGSHFAASVDHVDGKDLSVMDDDRLKNDGSRLCEKPLKNSSRGFARFV
jgi:type I restriction-modification system DNA methylase subunit